MAATPGPANIFAIAMGLNRGKRAALSGVIGMNCATLVWFAAAALGLGALIVAFPLAFRILAVAGGLYVAWLGIKAIRAGLRGDSAASVTARPAGRTAFGDGFLVQATNPKAVLFFTVVLPPFLRPAVGPAADDVRGGGYRHGCDRDEQLWARRSRPLRADGPSNVSSQFLLCCRRLTFVCGSAHLVAWLMQRVFGQ